MQKRVQVDQFIIKNLPNKEAHETLYRSFMEKASEYDLFIKVDADMVIEKEFLFRDIAHRFSNDKDLQHLCIAVHDYFSDRLIYGMHAYRSSYRWGPRMDEVLTDISKTSKVICRHDKSELAPACLHCPNPSDFQSYHFGLHKAAKVLHCLKIQRDWHASEHLGNLELLWKHFKRAKDRRLALAALGGEVALKKRYGAEEINYTNERVSEEAKLYCKLSNSQLTRKIKILRLRRLALMNNGDALGFLRSGLAYPVKRLFLPWKIRRILERIKVPR